MIQSIHENIHTQHFRSLPNPWWGITTSPILHHCQSGHHIVHTGHIQHIISPTSWHQMTILHYLTAGNFHRFTWLWDLRLSATSLWIVGTTARICIFIKAWICGSFNRTKLKVGWVQFAYSMNTKWRLFFSSEEKRVLTHSFIVSWYFFFTCCTFYVQRTL